MDVQQWLDKLATELQRRQLPKAYIARTVDELRDHITELIEDKEHSMSKDALKMAEIVQRVGDPESLAQIAMREHARGSFWGRHPIATFVLAPIPLVVIAWSAAFAVLFLCGAGATMIAEKLGMQPMNVNEASMPTVVLVGARVVFWLIVVLPPAAITVLLCSLARRNHVDWSWSLASCLLVAVIAGMFQAVLEPAATSQENGRMMLGFGLWLVPPLKQIVQFAIPLAIGLGLLWRQTRLPKGRGPESLPDTLNVERQAA